MFSLFPSQWSQPLPRGSKQIKNLADHHFPQPVTVKISKPAPAPAQPQIPVEELCLGENNDFTEIDLMLASILTPYPESRTERILQMINTVSEHLEKNIKIIQNVPSYEQDTVSRKEILKLLRMFSDYSKTIEQYIKEKQPSSF